MQLSEGDYSGRIVMIFLYVYLGMLGRSGVWQRISLGKRKQYMFCRRIREPCNR